MSKYENEEMLSLIKDAIDNSVSMAEACSKTGIHFNTFKRISVKYGWYDPNQGRKGRTAYLGEYDTRKIPLDEILKGNHPEYQTFKLKNRLFKEGIKENKCDECGIDNWMGKELQCELEHMDGNSRNHVLDNLKMLCPNCHSQTETFRAKNIKAV